MGWGSGSGVFGDIMDKVVQLDLPEDTLQKVAVAVIDALQMCDWDTETEALMSYKEVPAIVRAFGIFGIYLWGTPEYDEAYGENSVELKDQRDFEYARDSKLYPSPGLPQYNTADQCLRYTVARSQHYLLFSRSVRGPDPVYTSHPSVCANLIVR